MFISSIYIINMSNYTVITNCTIRHQKNKIKIHGSTYTLRVIL